jgi:PAS domain S-box-containing protein
LLYGLMEKAMLLHRLAFRFGLIALAPALLVSAALSTPMIELRRDQLLAQADERILQASRTTEMLYAEQMRFGQLLAQQMAERAAYGLTHSAIGDQAALDAFLETTQSQTFFDLVTLVEATGRVLAQDGMTHLWRNPPNAIVAGQRVWGTPDVGLVIEFYAPLKLPETPAHFLIGSLVLAGHNLNLFRERTGLEQSLWVGDTLVATSLLQHPEAEHRAILPAEQQVALLPVTQQVEINGVPYLARIKALYDTNGQTVALAEFLLPLDPVRAAQQQATTILLLITLLAIVAAALLVYTLSRWVLAPIDRLRWAARAIGQGQLDRAVHVEGPTELVTLGADLDAMRSQLAAIRTALADEKERYATILESINDAVITINAQGSITGFNQGAIQLLGWKAETTVGRNLAHVLVCADATLLTLDALPLHVPQRLAIRTADGRPRTVLVARTPLLGRSDSVREYVVVLHDLSDDLAVTRLKDEFLANITHEFQTPLAALNVSVELLYEADTDLRTEERRELLTNLHTGVRRLQHLVTNLLDSASIQAGYFRIDPDVYAVAPLVEEAVATIHPIVRQRRQHILLTLPPALPSVYVDGPRIIQALVNLIANASKFGPPGDSIGITVTVEQAYVRIGVTDHGPGVPPERQDNLFERFLRPGATTLHAQGAGLGLAISRAIVEGHGGTISMATRPHVDTTFSLTLPRIEHAPRIEAGRAVLPRKGQTPDAARRTWIEERDETLAG